jgi:orotate phosphoribosyltransferase
MNGPVFEQIMEGVRRVVALQLWQLGAIKVNLTEPFELVSGNYSPIYINCRQLISSPAFVDLFSAATRIICDCNNIAFDVVAGGETAGIPFAAFLAHSFGKPMVYVRKAAKEHGIASRVEGALQPGTHVLLVEDLITDAGSKLSFIEAIRGVQATVHDVLVVFDRLQGGKEALAQENIQLHSVTDMNIALEVGHTTKQISSADLISIHLYLHEPREWHVKHGLQFRD